MTAIPFYGILCIIGRKRKTPFPRIPSLYGFKLEFISERHLHVIWKQEKNKKSLSFGDGFSQIHGQMSDSQ